MLRTLALLGIVGCCAWVGFRAEGRLKRRYDTVRAMLANISALTMCMQYTARPLSELVQECKTDKTAVFWERFAEELNRNTVAVAWPLAMRHARERDGGFMSLQQEELAMFEEYARGLGGSDRYTQSKNAAMLEKRLDHVVSASLDTYSRKGRIYRSMGVLGGIAVAILLW